MAQELTPQHKKNIHVLALEILSKYDLNNKLVQSFVSKLSNDIQTRYGTLKVSSAKGTVTADTERETNITKPSNKKVNTRSQTLATSPVTTILHKVLTPHTQEDNKNTDTSIFSELKDISKKGIIPLMLKAFEKQKATDKNVGKPIEGVSYAKMLTDSFKKEGIKGALSELFVKQQQIVKQSTKDEDVNKDQSLDLFKDEKKIQKVVIDDFTGNAVNKLKDILKNVKPSSVQQSNTTDNSGGGSGGIERALLRTAISAIARRFLPNIKGGDPTTKTRKKSSTSPSSPRTRGSNPVKPSAPEKPVKAKPNAPDSESTETTGKKRTSAPEKPVKTKPNVLVRESTEIAEKKGSSVSEKPVKTKPNVLSREAAETAGKKGTRVLGREVAETVGKKAAKTGAKTLGKSLLKKIPGVGLIAGLGFGAQRALAGDWSGAGLEVASGAASTVPGWGTAASFGIDAALAGKDISRAVSTPEDAYIEPPVSQTIQPSTPISPATPPPVEVETPPQNWRSIQGPDTDTPVTPVQDVNVVKSGAADKQSPELKQIVVNTGKTNSQLDMLSQAIFKLAEIINKTGNSSTPQPIIVNNNGNSSSNVPSAAQVAASNVDPIRLVRSRFSV
jgi:hypothetical protein